MLEPPDFIYYMPSKPGTGVNPAVAQTFQAGPHA